MNTSALVLVICSTIKIAYYKYLHYHSNYNLLDLIHMYTVTIYTENPIILVVLVYQMNFLIKHILTCIMIQNN